MNAIVISTVAMMVTTQPMQNLRNSRVLKLQGGGEVKRGRSAVCGAQALGDAHRGVGACWRTQAATVLPHAHSPAAALEQADACNGANSCKQHK